MMRVGSWLRGKSRYARQVTEFGVARLPMTLVLVTTTTTIMRTVPVSIAVSFDLIDSIYVYTTTGFILFPPPIRTFVMTIIVT